MMNRFWNTLFVVIAACYMLSGCVSSAQSDIALAAVDVMEFVSAYDPCGSVVDSGNGQNVQVDTLAVHRQCLF